MRRVVLLLHNVRSCYNVGAMLRTAEGLGLERVYLTGYTPYPAMAPDERLPFLAHKIDHEIHKTALGAEHMVSWTRSEDIGPVIAELKATGYRIAALEQHERAMLLPDFLPPEKVALIVGREVEGIEPEVIGLADTVVEIPMHGQKESFNVASAAAMALYHLTYMAPR